MMTPPNESILMRMTLLASLFFMALGTTQPALAQASDEGIADALTTTLQAMGHPWTTEEMTLTIDPTQNGENNSRMVFTYVASVILDENLYRVYESTDENLFIYPSLKEGAKRTIQGYGDARFTNDTWIITVGILDRTPVQGGDPKSYFPENYPNRTVHDLFTPEGTAAHNAHEAAKKAQEEVAANEAANADSARSALSERLSAPWAGLAQCGPFTQVPITATFPAIDDETYFQVTLAITLGTETSEATYHAGHQDGRIRGRFDAWISGNQRGRFGDVDLTLSDTTMKGTLGDCTVTLMPQADLKTAQEMFAETLAADLSTLTGSVEGSQIGPSDTVVEMKGNFTVTDTGLSGTLTLPIFDANSRFFLGEATVPFALDFSPTQEVPLFQVGTVDPTQFKKSALNAFSVKGGCDHGTTIAWDAATKTLTLESGPHGGACFDTAQFTFR